MTFSLIVTLKKFLEGKASTSSENQTSQDVIKSEESQDAEQSKGI